MQVPYAACILACHALCVNAALAFLAKVVIVTMPYSAGGLDACLGGPICGRKASWPTAEYISRDEATGWPVN